MMGREIERGEELNGKSKCRYFLMNHDLNFQNTL